MTRHASRLQPPSAAPACPLSVFACGPWLRKVFPDLLGARISTPRREVFFFGTPPGDARFTWPNLPNYSEATYYGFPSIDNHRLSP